MESLAHVRRNLNACAAVLGASLVALAAPEVVAAEPVTALAPGQGLERPAPPFKLGHYEGSTSQTCSAEAAAEEVCERGEKIPISFTVMRNKIVDLKSAATTICYSGAIKAPAETFPMAFQQINIDTKREFSGTQLRYPGPVQKAAFGTIAGSIARGELSFATSVNEEGEPATHSGTYCQTPIVRWSAELVE